MEVSVQVGMTPEIIQKVRANFLFFFLPPVISVLITLRPSQYGNGFVIHWILISLFPAPLLFCFQLQDKATVLTTERKKVRLSFKKMSVVRWRLAEMDDKPLNLFNKLILSLMFAHSSLSLPNQRGKTVPEELVRAEDLSKYRQVASHAVSTAICRTVITCSWADCAA